MDTTSILFTKEVKHFGGFSVLPFNPDYHIKEIHRWVNQDYARFWGMSQMTLAQVKNEYQRILTNSTVYAGYFNKQFTFLIECYAPEKNPVGLHYNIQEGDYGMHILVAPPEQPRAKFTWNVFTTVMEFMFDYLQVQRVIVEPDIRNEKIHTINRRAGFVYQKQIQLPEKSAYLAFCTKVQYANAIKLQQNEFAH